LPKIANKLLSAAASLGGKYGCKEQKGASQQMELGDVGFSQDEQRNKIPLRLCLFVSLR
jgi:hypothetical protein